MTETSQERAGASPLQGDRGTTKIGDGVVLAIANAAAGEVGGAHLSHGGTRLPGDSSPTVGEFLGNITGGSGRPRGISVEVGESQAAVDLTINVDYGKNIASVAQELRRNVISRVESLTGLHVTEVNIVVNDLAFEQ
ncbi:Asp23/Gls24 family envelope stress response protein [Rubrobacter tropicus]|uniref:Asp23/Gls24 family envelope stress response protein n=1 Tax=Rubrobacter tropicus TaxID=2653851 RepID=UPI001A9D6966|nr:Asp23/Gls24 family envelope stress response protein [Rubrobacter tropicus]